MPASQSGIVPGLGSPQKQIWVLRHIFNICFGYLLPGPKQPTSDCPQPPAFHNKGFIEADNKIEIEEGNCDNPILQPGTNYNQQEEQKIQHKVCILENERLEALQLEPNNVANEILKKDGQLQANIVKTSSRPEIESKSDEMIETQKLTLMVLV